VLKGTPVARRYCQGSITRSGDYYGTRRRRQCPPPLPPPPRASTLTLLIPAVLPSSPTFPVTRLPSRSPARTQASSSDAAAVASVDSAEFYGPAACGRAPPSYWVKVNRVLTDSSSLRSIRAEKPDRVFKNAQRSTNHEGSRRDAFGVVDFCSRCNPERRNFRLFLFMFIEMSSDHRCSPKFASRLELGRIRTRKTNIQVITKMQRMQHLSPPSRAGIIVKLCNA
jgi:hypothetical protein